MWQRGSAFSLSRGRVGKRFLAWDDRSSLRGVWRNSFGRLKHSACLGIKSLRLHPVTTTAPFGPLPTKICEGLRCSIPGAVAGAPGRLSGGSVPSAAPRAAMCSPAAEAAGALFCSRNLSGELPDWVLCRSTGHWRIPGAKCLGSRMTAPDYILLRLNLRQKTKAR